MWELLTGDEPYSDMHCASIIGELNYGSKFMPLIYKPWIYLFIIVIFLYLLAIFNDFLNFLFNDEIIS